MNMRHSHFVISDTHFHHNKILEFGHRQFASIEEHNEHIVTCWNSVVTAEDTVWHLGDVIMATVDPKDYEILGRLNGKKNLIIGNHDTPSKIELYRPYFSKICAYWDIPGTAILSHIPVHESQITHRFGKNIHGHVHEHTLTDPRYINVSCEAVDYTPRRISDLLKAVKL